MPLSHRALLRLATVAATLIAVAPLSAATVTWSDYDGYSWNTDSVNWLDFADNKGPWANVSTAVAEFDSSDSAGTITIDKSSLGDPLVEVNTLNVRVAGYALAPGSGNLTFAGINPTIYTGPAAPLTINAPLFGSSGLTFSGFSTVTLGGVSTYSGGTNLVNATVVATVDHAIPLDNVSVDLHSNLDVRATNQSFTALTLDGSLYIGGVLVSSGNLVPGTKQVNVTSISGSGNIVLGNGGILIATVTDSLDTFAGHINPNHVSTDGTLDKEGIGALALTGIANLTGAFSSVAYYVGGGTLIGTTSNINNTVFVNSGATLAFQQNTDGVFNGAISGAGHIQIASASTSPVTVTFGNPNTHTGDTTLFSHATLAIADDNQLGTLATTTTILVGGFPVQHTTFAYATLIFQGGTLRTLNPIISQRNLELTTPGGVIDTNLQASTFYGPITELPTTINGIPIAGTGPLTITGGGTATFSSPGLAPVTSAFDSLIINNAAVIFDNNNVTLSGRGTSLSVGQGSFTLQNAAILSTKAASIGGSFPGAAVVLDGASTTWTASGTVNLATNSGTGSLTLQNAAHATMTTLEMSNGLATLASLTIISGAALDTQNASIGNANGQAAATVSGAGSTWTVDQNLALANGAAPQLIAANSLTISDHAAVAVAGNTTLASASNITVNAATFTTGALANIGNSTSIAIADASPGAQALTLGADTAPDAVYSGIISNYQNSSGSVLKVGANTQTLSANNTYTGSSTSNGGNLILAGSTASSSFTANNTGTLTLSGLAINLGFTAINATASTATVAYTNNTAITGGFLFGPGTHSFNSASLTGTQIFNGAQVNVTAAIFTAVNSAAAISVSAGTTGLTWNGGTNAGSLTLQSFATANLSNFTSSGVISVGALANLNINSADLILSGGSRTTITGSTGAIVNGVPVVTFPGHLNLTAGNSIQLNGGLLTNNGIITGPTYVNFGGVAKGSGTYGQVFVTDGGTFSPGNSPGNATTADTTWESAGNYQWQIDDAAGNPGVGFDHQTINGALTITAGQTTNSRFIIQIASLDTADNPDLAANFNPAQSYSWQILSASAGITGFNPNDFTLDTTNFQNNLAGGSFSLNESGNALDLNFTPASVPEPTTLAILALPLLLLLPRRRKPA